MMKKKHGCFLCLSSVTKSPGMGTGRPTVTVGTSESEMVAFSGTTTVLFTVPYTKETREYFLRRLLEVELLVHEIGPDEIKDVPLITMEELKFIRQLWLDEFHEFDDSLPRIYEEVTGKKYSDGTISKNKYFGATEAELLKEVCAELYPNEQLLAEMQRALLDTEAKAAAISNKRNVILNFEKEIKKAFYKDEADAESIASTRALRISGITDEANPDDLVD